MLRDIKRKALIYGVIAAILAVVIATTVSGDLFTFIQEKIFYPSDSTSEPEFNSLPETSETIPVSIDELSNKPSDYHGLRVLVSGKVSQLGQVKGPYFMMDEKIWVCYIHEEASIDISSVENGDYVTVKGRFWAIDTIYAEHIGES